MEAMVKQKRTVPALVLDAAESCETVIILRARNDESDAACRFASAGERWFQNDELQPLNPTAVRTNSMVCSASARAFLAPARRTSSTSSGFLASSLRLSRNGVK